MSEEGEYDPQTAARKFLELIDDVHWANRSHGGPRCEIDGDTKTQMRIKYYDDHEKKWLFSIGFDMGELRALGRLIAASFAMYEALKVIRDMPIPEQDNMLAANMRKVADQALASADGEAR